MSKNTFFKYYILLVGIFVLPVLLMIPRVFNQFQSDIGEVNDRIPEFEIVDNEINTDHEPYIQFTDTTALYFDPNNELTEDNVIERNVELGFSPLNIAMNKTELTFYINGISQSVPYSALPDFNYEQMTVLLGSLADTSLSIILFTLVILFSINGFVLLYQFLMIALSNFLIAILSGVRLKMSEVFKITLLAITLPITAITITRSLNIISTNTIQLFTLFSIFIFMAATWHFKKIYRTRWN